MNLIGEHTDYNDGLCLPFPLDRGITVTAKALQTRAIEAHARDLGESHSVHLDTLAKPPDVSTEATWTRFVRGAATELDKAGIRLKPCRLEIGGDLPREQGLSSSAALSTALCLALCAIAETDPPPRIELARLCSRVENDWVGAQTGLLDQLAVLCGEPGHAIRIDMHEGPEITKVPLELRGHVLATLDSGASRNLAASGYNERRAECRKACELLKVDSLRDATTPDGLPEPLNRRVRHVLTENERVDAAVQALEAGDLEELGRLLDASHASLRDDYEVSTAEVEQAVTACKKAGASGARIMGGGFGGSVLALFPPGTRPPEGAVPVSPGPPAHLL